MAVKGMGKGKGSMEAVEKAVHEFTTALNGRDVDSMMAVFADDAVIQFPTLGKTDVAGFRQFLGQATSGLTSNHMEEKELFLAEYGAALRYTYDATTKSGRTARIEGVDAWVFGPDGKATDLTVYGDVTPLMEALSG